MRRHILHIFSMLLCLAVLLPPRMGVRAQNVSPMLVIIGSAAGMTDISSALLRRAFQGQPAEYQPGKRLLPLNHPAGSPARGRFDRAVLGLTPDEVGRFWVDQKIRGAAQPPRTLPSATLAVRVVASFAGAITYTDPSLLRSGVVVLSIDGRKPTDPGYLFDD